MPGSPDTLPAPDLPTGRRFALVVATSRYADPSLRQLRAPARDATDLKGLLADPQVGGFSVSSVVDGSAQDIRLAVDEFLAGRDPEDLVLVYLSCHGLVDLRRRLYFSGTDTLKNRLAATGVEAQWLLDQLDDCRARRQVVILDCCFSGAFARGAKADTDLALGERFHGQGRGRVVLTASRGTEYSFEGEPLPGSAMPGSVFTGALVTGISTGAADDDNDGYISVDDAYAFAFDRIRATDAQQTPQRWLYGAEGTIVLARSPAGVRITPAPLPDTLRTALDSSHPAIRLGAVTALGEWLDADDPSRALAARTTLRKVAENDVQSVAAAAKALLDVEPARSPSAAAGGTSPREHSAAGDGPSAAPRRWPPNRRVVYAGAATVAVAAGVTAAVLLVPDGRDPPGGDSSSASGVFTATSPWRLAVSDEIEGTDNGCTVTVTQAGTGERKVFKDIYGAKSFQIQLTGSVRWEANDSGCVVVQRSGPGNATLPFAQETGGDTDAFQAPKVPGKVAVSVLDFNGNAGCHFVLRDAANGRDLDFGEIPKGGGPLLLDPNGRPSVYLADSACRVRVGAG